MTAIVVEARSPRPAIAIITGPNPWTPEIETEADRWIGEGIWIHVGWGDDGCGDRRLRELLL
jgi:hypothetical protein